MRLSKALNKAAKKVWDELRPAQTTIPNRIHLPREEALTSLMHRELAESGCPDVKKVWMFGSEEEHAEGFDFEIWVGNENNKWLQFLVQAKKLKGHEVGSFYEIDQAQLATIFNFHRPNENAIPLYALYNHISGNSDLSPYHISLNGFKKSNLGVTLIKPGVMNGIPRKNFRNVHASPGGHTDFGLKKNDLAVKKIEDLFDWCDAAFPLHELANIDIEVLDNYYQKPQVTNPLIAANHYFFFFWGGNSEHNPVQKGKSIDSIFKGFKKRKIGYNKELNVQALVIIQKDGIAWTTPNRNYKRRLGKRPK